MDTSEASIIDKIVGEEGPPTKIKKLKEYDDIAADVINFVPICERQFTKFYARGSPGVHSTENEDLCILVHSNKICVLTLSPYHPIIAKKLIVTNVNYKVTEKLDRADNKFSGKGKRGAQLLDENSIICSISCEGVSGPFIVRANLIGALLEINEKLLTQPQLLSQSNLGYLAIISPRVSDYSKQMAKFLTEDQYEAQIKAPPPPPP